MVSERLKAVTPSVTLAINSRVQELEAEGKDIVKFGVGEPDYPTPEHIKEAARKAIAQDKTRYTPAAGIPQLREAVVEKFSEENNLHYKVSQVMVSVGAKQAIYNSLMALVNPGDEVIVIAPYWVSYPEQVKLAGGVPVVVQTTEDTNFKVTPEALRDAISPRTRALILNTPNNPTGIVYSSEELAALGQVMLEHDIWAICDDIYESLVYDKALHTSLPTACPDMFARSIVINGVSKAYAMTGWRIGYAGGPEEIISAMSSCQGHATSNPTSVSQWAALAALQGPKGEVREMVQDYGQRRDYMAERLQNIAGFEFTKPRGAFYLFPNVSELIGRSINGTKVTDVEVLAKILLEEAHVALVPGSGFGAPENLRFSYSAAMDRIEEGMDRLQQALD